MNRNIGSDRSVYLICPESETSDLLHAITDTFDYTVYPDTSNNDLSLLRRLEILTNACDMVIYYDGWSLDFDQNAILAYADALGIEMVHFETLMQKLYDSLEDVEMDCD